jgi:hypothetical protein
MHLKLILKGKDPYNRPRPDYPDCVYIEGDTKYKKS